MRPYLLAVTLLLATTSHPVSGESRRLAIQSTDSRVTFVVDATLHKVHGRVELVDSELRFDPETGDIEGQLLIDATSADTGNKKRDRKMHASVLRSSEHPTIVLETRNTEGLWLPDDASSLILHASLRLLDVDHDVSIPLTVTADESGLRVEGSFVIPYVAWGLENPSRFMLRVGKEVEIQFDLRGSLSP
jgi:polyisoprenoid-binding protein YceI